MRVTLATPTETILKEIAKPEMKRRDVAQTYALCMQAASAGKAVDWSTINKAIMARWSQSGLIWIKTQAASGNCFESAK